MPSITITIPGSVAKVKAGAICVKGTTDNNGAGAILVKGKVYHNQTSPPLEPPAEAIVGTPGTNFAFDSISGAQSSSTTPYPANTIAIWAKFAADPNTYHLKFSYFDGKEDTKNDCET